MASQYLEIPHLAQPLKLWERIELVVGEEEKSGHYWARVEDFINDGILISEPQFINGKTLLRKGCEVMVVIMRQDAAYHFHSRIRTIGTKGERKLLLQPPRRVQRLQRRRTVRIDFSTTVTYARIIKTMEWEELQDRLEWHTSHSINISAGGLLMACQPDVESGDLLLLQIALPGELSLPETLAGVVRRLISQGENHVAGVELLTDFMLGDFFDSAQVKRLPESIRHFTVNKQHHLANYIFQQQVELRQKGLL